MTKLLVASFLVGCCFLPLFIILAGGGHGLYFPIAAVSAPLSVLPWAVTGFPLLTALMVWCAATSPRKLFLLVMGIHYVSGAWIGWAEYRHEASDPYFSFYEKLADFTPLLVALAVFYLLCQVLLWTIALRKMHPVST